MRMGRPGEIVQLHTGAGWGGGESQVYQLAAGLRNRGIPCRLFCRAGGMLLDRAKAAGLAAEPLPRWLPGSRLAGRLQAARTAVVHVHDSRALAIGLRAAGGAGIPLVLSRRIASPLRANPRSRRKYSPRRIAAVLAISETVRDVMVRCGFPADRIFVAPSGLDLGALDAAEPDLALRGAGPGPVVGGIGALSRKKNWTLLLRTAARLRQAAPDLRWVIAGDGPERRRLDGLARELGVSGCVHFLGFRPDALRVLSSLDLLFFPSRMEGAGVTVREAMAMGVPVVAARAPGTVESLDGHGWLVDPDDVEGAARTVRRVLDDPEERTRVAAAARDSARRRFSFDATLTRTLHVYERVAAGIA